MKGKTSPGKFNTLLIKSDFNHKTKALGTIYKAGLNSISLSV